MTPACRDPKTGTPCPHRHDVVACAKNKGRCYYGEQLRRAATKS